MPPAAGGKRNNGRLYTIPRRGEIWLVSLDPTIGHEIRKTRPAVVVTNDVYNEHNWVVIIMPLSSSPAAEYDQVLIQPLKA